MYAVIVINYDPDPVHMIVPSFEVSTLGYKYTDIKQAEKARIAYLDLYPELNPQNVQVISWSP